MCKILHQIKYKYLRRIKWIKINDHSLGKYDTNSQIKCNTSMLKLGLCDYSDVCILVSETITVAAFAAGGGNNDNKQVVFKNCVPFTVSII